MAKHAAALIAGPAAAAALFATIAVEARADDAGSAAATWGDAAAAPAPGDAGAPEWPADAHAAAPPASVPPALLRGSVVARGGGRPLRAATVYLDGAPVAEIDTAGTFAAAVPPGRHRLQVLAPEHEPADLAIDVQHAGWAGTVRLTPGGPRYEIVVSAGREPTGAVRIPGEEARRAAGAGGDPFRVIESLPGVSQVVWPLALYAIRGANPGNTGFFLDGMRVPALFHFALGPSIVHPSLVDEISFYPGGYPARLGGYVSGVVAASTAAPPSDTRRFSTDLRLYDAGAMAAAPWDRGRGTVLAAARYAYTGLLVSRFLSDVSYGYADYQVRADHGLGAGRATLLALGSFDSLDIRNQGVGQASLAFHRLDLRWERPAAGGRLQARATLATDHARSQLYDSPIDVRAYTAAPRLGYVRSTDSGASFQLGADAEAQRFGTDVAFAERAPAAGTPTPPNGTLLGDLARSRDALSLGAFAALAVKWRALSLEPGIRYSRSVEQGVARGAFQPRLMARLGLGGSLALEAVAGRFAQMPSLPLAVGGFEAFGLRDLGLQTSTQAALTLEARLASDLVLRVTGCNQWLLVSDLRSTIARDVREPTFLEMRRGRGTGAELLLRVADQARVHGWLGYTLSWSVREFDGVDAPSDWDQRHIVNLVAAARLGRGYSVGGRFHYGSGRPYPVRTPLQTVEYQRLPAFWQVDLRADKRMIFDRYRLDLFLELANATLTRQVTALEPVDDPAAPPRQVGFRIVLPSIGLHAEW